MLVSNSIRQPVMLDERCSDRKQQVQRIGSYDHARRSVSVATVLRFMRFIMLGGSFPIQGKETNTKDGEGKLTIILRALEEK